MFSEAKLEELVKQLEVHVSELEKKIVNLPIGKISYKKCHDCKSDLVPPLKIVHE